MAFDEASALAVRTQWGNMATCASITLLPQNRNINYPTKLIVIYSNICCAVDWSGVISPKALWQKKLYFGSNFRPCCSADGSLRERFEVMMVARQLATDVSGFFWQACWILQSRGLGRGSAWSRPASQDSFRNKISRKFHKKISHDFSGGRL